MIHEDTIIDILGDSEGIMIKDLPSKLQCYSGTSPINQDMIWEPYGITNPELSTTPDHSARLQSIEKIYGDYRWYEVYFKETDKSVIVTADELIPCIYTASYIGLSDNGKYDYAALPISVTELRKINERKMLFSKAIPNSAKYDMLYCKPLIRRANIESNVAYRIITTSGMYGSNGLLMLGLNERNVEWWITRQNIHELYGAKTDALESIKEM